MVGFEHSAKKKQSVSLFVAVCGLCCTRVNILLIDASLCLDGICNATGILR